MVDTRWSRLEAVFGKAVELPPESWDEVVGRECGDDTPLREEVLQLLRLASTSEGYLDGLARRSGLPPTADSPEDLVGKRAGPYRLVKLLGRGGMGAVYLGERQEDGFTIKAAVKLVASGALSGAARRRFLEERRILSALRHPNIARLFDGGFTEDGSPYFVMEYVDGLPVHEYCDRHRLSVRRRIEISLQVCRAVQHAHQNFVIHRDLKPNNVLVTADGDVKLLDFGIARTLEDGEAAFRTATRSPHPMTLAYASPEQVRNLPVSTATDVYGLALLIYRLVTGRHPYEIAGGSLSQAEKTICETDPLPPHRALDECPTSEAVPGEADAGAQSCDEIARLRRTSLSGLRRSLGGDLGRILLKALRKEPERRYQTVGALADDLRRYLDGLPVSARPDTRWYLLSRFVSRHKTGVATAALVATLVMALVVLGIRYTLTTRAQAVRIAQEAATTQEVTDLLLEILSLADPEEGAGDTLTVRAALERGVTHQRDRFSHRPELRARILEVMARAYVGLGMDVEATSLLQEALALRPETGEMADTAIAGTLLRLAGAYQSRGRFAEALSFDEQAVDLLARLGADSTKIAVAMGASGIALAQMDGVDSARVLSGRALGILRRHAGEGDRRTLTQALGHARILRMAQEPDSAEGIYRRVISNLELEPDGGGQLGSMALNNLGYLMRVKGQYGEAARLYRQALDRYGAWMSPAARGTALQNLASVQGLQGDSAAAALSLEQRLRFARAAWPKGGWRVGDAALSFGRLLLLREKYGQAEPFLRDAVANFTQDLGPDHGWTANAESILGEDLAHLGKFEEAEPLLLAAFDKLMAGPGPGDRWTVDSVQRLAECYELWGRPTEAARYRDMIQDGG